MRGFFSKKTQFGHIYCISRQNSNKDIETLPTPNEIVSSTWFLSLNLISKLLSFVLAELFLLNCVYQNDRATKITHFFVNAYSLVVK